VIRFRIYQLGGGAVIRALSNKAFELIALRQKKKCNAEIMLLTDTQIKATADFWYIPQYLPRSPPNKKRLATFLLQVFVTTGRGGEIRTPDPLHPMQVRYQAALRPEGADYSRALRIT